ncbi:Tyrosine recombinase XerD [compost metagenome]
MNAVNNVVGLHRGTVGEDIEAFIGKFISGNTQANYRRSIERFFMWYKGKKIDQLTSEDIYIRNVDIIKYQTFLRDHEADYTNNTINNIIAAIQSLYEFLEKNEYSVNSTYVKVDSLPDDSESAGALYLYEAEQMAELIKLQRSKGQEKSAFIRMAYTTSFRKSSLLNLKWTDIAKHPEADYYLVSTIGKGGKKHTVAISNELYDELLLIKDMEYYNRYNDDKIFHLSNTTIQQMIEWLKQQLNIGSERNVVFHSFRNVAASYGTLEEVKSHLNHSNINTTEKFYRKNMRDHSQDISLRIEDKIDDNIFDVMSREELIQLIKQQNTGALIEMKKEAREILNSKGAVI